MPTDHGNGQRIIKNSKVSWFSLIWEYILVRLLYFFVPSWYSWSSKPLCRWKIWLFSVSLRFDVYSCLTKKYFCLLGCHIYSSKDIVGRDGLGLYLHHSRAVFCSRTSVGQHGSSAGWTAFATLTKTHHQMLSSLVRKPKVGQVKFNKTRFFLYAPLITVLII